MILDSYNKYGFNYKIDIEQNNLFNNEDNNCIIHLMKILQINKFNKTFTVKMIKTYKKIKKIIKNNHYDIIIIWYTI